VAAELNAVAAFARRDIAGAERFADGVNHDTYKITFRGDHEPVVLRIYRRADKLPVEVSALRAVRGKVPAPAVLHVEPDGAPPFVILEYVDGLTFREFRRRADRALVGEVSYRIGRTLAAIHAIAADTFAPAGELDIAETPLLGRRVDRELLRRVQSFVASRRGELRESMTRQCFTHGDFNNRNVLVRRRDAEWEVAAVVDWESAGLDTPLHDVARFLQYETRATPLREPSFSRGYLDGGGSLPEQWWSLSRAINLVDQCRLLSEENVPDEIVREVVGLMEVAVAENAAGPAA
jgi:aminoglycoside phosphotransferase (APT) family kinase protein